MGVLAIDLRLLALFSLSLGVLSAQLNEKNGGWFFHDQSHEEIKRVVIYRTIHHHDNLSVEAIAEELNMAPSYLARAALPDADMAGANASGVRFPLNNWYR